MISNAKKAFDGARKLFRNNRHVCIYVLALFVLFVIGFLPIVKADYYYDDDKELQSGKLSLYDKENETFTVNDVSYKKDRLLGKADKGYQFVGSLLNFLTSRVVYLILFIVPILALLVYEIVVFIKYCIKDKKTGNNDEKKKKK